MLSYIISAAVAAVVGTAGGFVGSRMANTNLRRTQASMLDVFDDQVGEVQKRLVERPTRDELLPFVKQVGELVGQVGELSGQQQAMAQALVTREELKPILAEVISRPELDMALQAVVMGLGGAPAQEMPSIQPVFRGSAPAVVAEPQEQLASVLAGLSERMAQINQQLGIG